MRRNCCERKRSNGQLPSTPESGQYGVKVPPRCLSRLHRTTLVISPTYGLWGLYPNLAGVCLLPWSREFQHPQVRRFFGLSGHRLRNLDLPG
jgi:hypothetical protein